MILFNFFKGQKLKTGACKVDVPESCSSQHLNVPSLKKSKLPYKDILMNDDRYKNKQSTILTIKGEPHEATCRHCKHTITPGTLCFRIEGTICVEYKTKNVVEKSLYYHASNCITSSQPIWTNVRKPTCFEVSPDVTDLQIQQAKNNCSLYIVGK